MILLIDNYDSFVHNLARYFRVLGEETLVVRNDAIDAAGVRELSPEAIVLSPGPCTPNEAGCSVDVVRQLHRSTPILGICLGHQAIGAALGAKICRAPRPVHGQASVITHNAAGVFEDQPNPLRVGRYHSLIVDAPSLPASLTPTAWTASDSDRDGNRLVMAMQHATLPVVGLQFHPESVLTDGGLEMMANFLRIARREKPRRDSPGGSVLAPHALVAPSQLIASATSRVAGEPLQAGG